MCVMSVHEGTIKTTNQTKRLPTLSSVFGIQQSLFQSAKASTQGKRKKKKRRKET